MPLDPLQERIARTALSLPEAHTLALAGGAAMIAHGFVTRVTKDIDLFTEIDDAEAIQIAASLRAALAQQNLDTRDAERPPLDHRFVAVDPPAGGNAPSRSSPTAGGSRAASASTSAQSCTPMISQPTKYSRCGDGHGHAITSTCTLSCTATNPTDSSTWPR